MEECVVNWPVKLSASSFVQTNKIQHSEDTADMDHRILNVSKHVHVCIKKTLLYMIFLMHILYISMGEPQFTVSPSGHHPCGDHSPRVSHA